MSFASRHNKGSRFDIDIKGFSFVSLETLYKDNKDAVYTMNGVYINRKSEYGDHPVAIVVEGEHLVDFPSYMTAEINEMLRNDADVDAINAGEAKFKVETYKAKNHKNKLCYGVRWVD